MAVQKFSQITQSAVGLTAADFLMAVQNGTTDLLYTPTQVTAGLNVFTAALKGMVPASGGGTANFMRADGSWAVPPGTTAPGGAVNTVQFNSAGGFGGMSGTAWDDTNRSLVLTGATLTTSHPVFDLSQTWNAGGVTFTGLRLNVTSTASAAASLLLDLQVASSSIFNVNKAGQVTLLPGVVSAPSLIFSTNSSATGLFQRAGATNSISFASGGFNFMEYTFFAGSNPAIATLSFSSDCELSWCSTPQNAGGSGSDIAIWRDAAGVLAQVNSTTAQALRIYNTWTSTTNFERGGFDWQTTANVFRIRSEAGGGGGTQRIIAVDGFNKAGVPANTDIPAGTYGFLRDTSNNHTYLIYNNAGTIQKVELL